MCTGKTLGKWSTYQLIENHQNKWGLFKTAMSPWFLPISMEVIMWVQADVELTRTGGPLYKEAGEGVREPQAPSPQGLGPPACVALASLLFFLLKREVRKSTSQVVWRRNRRYTGADTTGQIGMCKGFSAVPELALTVQEQMWTQSSLSSQNTQGPVLKL